MASIGFGKLASGKALEGPIRAPISRSGFVLPEIFTHGIAKFTHRRRFQGIEKWRVFNGLKIGELVAKGKVATGDGETLNL